MMHYLYENQNIPQKLEKYIKENKALHAYFDVSFQGIKPKNYCGFLSIDNESYFIIPKIVDNTVDVDTQNLNTFMYMLMYGYDVNLKHEDLMQGIIP
ncbi:MAG: hypothetical protein L3J43_03090 [Sulfurovum sp.]|nr:hypothetical protein [Sulfurovum sp.]